MSKLINDADTNLDLRLLVVDEDESISPIISQVLAEEKHTIDHATSGEKALAIFQKQMSPIVVTDIVLKGMSGIELLKEIKKLSPDTLVIISTGNASLDSAISALRAGAYDYIIKPFEDIEVLASVINRAVEHLHLFEQNRMLVKSLKQSNQELEEINQVFKELAIKDGLTGLYNHRHFRDSLRLEVTRSKRHKREFSLIFLDVDYFKKYNDTQGHPEGDKLLVSLAKIIRKRLRKLDLAARYGGEEFVILLPETSKQNAQLLAEEIRKTVESTNFKGREMQPLGKVTVSLGVATFMQDGNEGSDLLEHADRMLYQAKHKGRNQVA